MSRLLALTASPDEVQAVHPVAQDLGRALRAEVVLGALPAAGETRTTELLAAAGPSDVLLLVLATPPGGAADAVTDLLLCCPKPLVLVPCGAPARRTGSLARVLVPLDGTQESAAAVEGSLALFAASGLDLVVLHVLREATTPRFWDQPVHARQSWESEFLARFCPAPGARLELRRGVAGESILDVAESEQADLIALGWSQPGSPDRARTVWATLAGARVPVMLVPVPSPERADLPAAAATAQGAR